MFAAETFNTVRTMYNVSHTKKLALSDEEIERRLMSVPGFANDDLRYPELAFAHYMPDCLAALEKEPVPDFKEAFLSRFGFNCPLADGDMEKLLSITTIDCLHALYKFYNKTLRPLADTSEVDTVLKQLFGPMADAEAANFREQTDLFDIMSAYVCLRGFLEAYESL